jgi:hypothetical protein
VIVLKPPSLSKPWDEFVSVDKSFVQMPAIPGDDASEEDVAAFKKALEEYLAKLKAARETGDWTPMLAPGQTLTDATRFTLTHIDGNVWRELMDRNNLPHDSKRRLGGSVLRALLVRLAVKAISGCEFKIERKHYDDFDCVMTQPEVVDMLDKENPAIVGELGNRIIERLRGVGPLSSKG